MLAEGLSNVVGSALGVPGMSLGPSLVGVSGATGATSRVIGFAELGPSRYQLESRGYADVESGSRHRVTCPRGR